MSRKDEVDEMFNISPLVDMSKKKGTIEEMGSMSKEKECDNNHSILYLIDADKGIYECQCNKLFELKEVEDK